MVDPATRTLRLPSFRQPPMASWASPVIGAVHTHTIEDFWSIIKRGVVGTFHKVSKKYLPIHVAEFQFSYNSRENADPFRTAIGGC